MIPIDKASPRNVRNSAREKKEPSGPSHISSQGYALIVFMESDYAIIDLQPIFAARKSLSFIAIATAFMAAKKKCS
jgi:hypothetical protein